jgi:GntR family transcriptional regulator
MTPWIYPGFRLPCGPAWKAIVTALELAIRSGQVRAGDVLPSQRLMADFMGVHLNTVNRAMREAARRGLTAAHTRRGTMVIARPTS